MSTFGRQQYKEMDVQRLSDYMARQSKFLDDKLVLSFGEPSGRIVSSYSAHFGELVQCDPRSGGFTISLPKIRPRDIGKGITICNLTSSNNAVTVRAEDVVNGTSVTVNGVTSIDCNKGYFVRHAVAVSESTWLLMTVNDGATMGVPAPFFEWNGVDTSQFGSAQNGAFVTGTSLTVVSLNGSNWLRINVTTSAGGADEIVSNCSLYPALVTPATADYDIHADVCVIRNVGAAYGWGGVACRWVSGTRSGSYYLNYLRDNTFLSSARRMNDTTFTSYFAETVANVGTGNGHTLHMELEHDSILRVHVGSRPVYRDSSTPLTAAGAPAICAGVQGAAAGNIYAYFHNIRCFSQPHVL